jgi:hypothetical protein
MYSQWGTVGDDLAQVYANDYDHTWTLTMHGVTYSHGFDSYTTYDEWDEYLVSNYYTFVRATSFEFEFSGPDADVLNDVVSRQLVAGGDGGDVLILENSIWYSLGYDSLVGKYGGWSLHLSPLDSADGVSFHILGNWGIVGGFASDADGYPLAEPRRIRAYDTRIIDHRNGNYGIVTSFNDDVNIGSTEPPVVKPALNIVDGSVLEGRKGTTRLNLTVKLTQFVSSPVTVSYATADGTALKKSDYTAKSGKLTILPGQAEATVPLAIKGDRKREPDETFTVRLSNAVGAYISDSEATVTILNDD